MQSSHPVKHFSMPTSKKMHEMSVEVDSKLSHTSKVIVYFMKLSNGLILTDYAKIFSKRLTGFLKHPIVTLPRLILHHKFIPILYQYYCINNISCLASSVILDSSSLGVENTLAEF